MNENIWLADPRKVWFSLTGDVTLRDGESQESLLRRFQKSVQISGILKEVKSHSRFKSKRDAYLIKAKNNARRKRRQSR
jgi:ribosomal protein S21